MKKLLISGACALLIHTSAHAQLFQSLINKVLDNSGSSSQKQNGNTANQNQGASILGNAPAVPAKSEPQSGIGDQYSTKQALLEGARKGELVGYATMPDYYLSKEGKSMAYAIGLILANDYGTPVPNWDERNKYAGGNSRIWCIQSDVKEQMHNILRLVTAAKVQTYSDQPPEFLNDRTEDKRPAINAVFKHLRTSCYQTVLGQNQPFPFIDKLSQLMKEYAQATEDFVIANRADQKEQYQIALAKQKAEEEQRAEEERKAAVIREAEAKLRAEEDRKAELIRKAQEQREIDAEHKRIQEQERKAKEIERKRVAG